MSKNSHQQAIHSLTRIISIGGAKNVSVHRLQENVDSCVCVSDIHVCLGLFVKSGRTHTFQLVLQVRAFAAKLAGIQSV